MISVVIPLYNKAHTILRTLNSVMNQTYGDFEIIIVNDGSTDDGVQKIRENFHDPRIHIINQENQGVSVARNRGIQEAKYNYIALLDGDDEWHPEYLQIMSENILQNPDAGLFSSGGLIQNKDRTYYRLSKKHLNYQGKINWFENPFVFSHTSGSVINKMIFEKTDKFPQGMFCLQDFALFFQIATISDVIYIGLPISKYVGGIKGQTTSIDKDTQYKYLKYVVFFYSLIYQKYLEKETRNHYIPIWLKYDIRHRFKGYLKKRDQRFLTYFYNNLDNSIMGLFNCYEKYCYRNKMRLLGVFWINLTKIRWRMYGFPIVGETPKISKIPQKFRFW